MKTQIKKLERMIERNGLTSTEWKYIIAIDDGLEKVSKILQYREDSNGNYPKGYSDCLITALRGIR